MQSYIDGRIGENRALEFESATAFTGEHRANILAISLDGSGLEGADCYFLHFETAPGAGYTVTNPITDENGEPAYIDDDIIFCPLTRELTGTGRLYVQLSAVFLDGESARTVKSGTARLDFASSLLCSGENTMNGNGGIMEEIAALREQVQEALERDETPDYGYIAAAAAANLMRRGPDTFVHLTADDDDADETVTRLIDTYTPGSGETHYVVTHGGGANLYRVSETDGEIAVGAFTGAEILALMKEEMNI